MPSGIVTISRRRPQDALAARRPQPAQPGSGAARLVAPLARLSHLLDGLLDLGALLDDGAR